MYIHTYILLSVVCAVTLQQEEAEQEGEEAEEPVQSRGE